ncbi:aspartyl protease family protein [Novosphingobium sp. PhB55]|uniref:retropepsin-like aspartic protease family protein n=1 Tax=Novosphingobium sp. PhB55 TaxID=2485106 RepID=UPI00106500E8|nr:TIGR02281 family clan AA aspartic protease [Novosphingobium sp. PhB55]TDW68684.1 aspartyl protease family protein [Novosphingobium sp. PhB55]
MNLGQLTDLFYAKPLLALTILAILVAVLAGMLADRRPRLGQSLRNLSHLGLVAALLLTVTQVALHNTRSEAALWLDETRPPSVEGGETVIPLRADGHYWIQARLNGEPVDFLIDTGATYTGISKSVAERAGIQPDGDDQGVMLETANGTIVARMASAASLAFGSIEAHALPVAIGPDNEVETNVIGMNLLSQLAAWRVENGRLILVPRAAAAQAPSASSSPKS